MRSLVVLSVLFLTACSSESKKPEAMASAPAAPAAAPTKVETTKPTGRTKVECSIKGDARVLEARAKGKGCELGYTKAGKEGVVASSGNGTEYCQKALEKLRDKLKGSGYDCK